MVVINLKPPTKNEKNKNFMNALIQSLLQRIDRLERSQLNYQSGDNIRITAMGKDRIINVSKKYVNTAVAVNFPRQPWELWLSEGAR